jgi:hypothetical protein
MLFANSVAFGFESSSLSICSNSELDLTITPLFFRSGRTDACTGFASMATDGAVPLNVGRLVLEILQICW